jgi:hypothetical protein
VYCLHPRVIALSFLPLIIMTVASLGLGFLYWNDAVDMLRTQLDSYQLVSSVSQWLEGLGLGNLRQVLAPALLLFLAIPVIVITSLLFVAVLMTPAMVSLVGERRFATLERRQGGSLAASLVWSLASTLLACIALVLSFPLWLVPPLVLVSIGSIGGTTGKLAFLVWMISMVMGFLQSFTSNPPYFMIVIEHGVVAISSFFI